MLAESVRSFLMAYRKAEDQIDEMLDKLRARRSRAISIGAQELSDMPKGPTNIADTLTEYIIQIEEMETRINRMIDQHNEDRAAIKSVVARMKSDEYRRIITYRYLYGMEWSDIQFELYRFEKDYSGHQEAYRRRMYRAHESALEEMGKLW